MKLLIVGGTSPTGKHLLDLLRRDKIQFQALGDKYFEPNKAMDIAKTITEYNPTQLINLASYKSRFHSAMQKAEKAPERCFEVQAQLPGVFAEICNHLNLPMLHLSNAYVFDGTKRLAYNEQDETNPQGVYGLTTLEGEQKVAQHPLHIILRRGWLFGETKTSQITSWVKSAQKHKGQLQVTNRRFSPTATPHLANAILAIAKQVDCDANAWGTYHYSGLETKTEQEFVEQTIKYAANHDETLYGLLKVMRVGDDEPRFPEIPNSTLSSKKLFDTFGIKQKSWHGQLQEVVKALFQRDSFDSFQSMQDAHLSIEKSQTLAEIYDGVNHSSNDSHG